MFSINVFSLLKGGLLLFQILRLAMKQSVCEETDAETHHNIGGFWAILTCESKYIIGQFHKNQKCDTEGC